MQRFFITDLPISGLKLIERKKLDDPRGFFSRLFCARELFSAGWVKPLVQINHSYTARCGTVRGLHFQLPPHTEMKIVICLKGEIWDVAVDIRSGSPTFLKWHAEVLSERNNLALLIPEGFAHGFQTMTDHVEILYLHSAYYVPEAEGGINPQDRHLSIRWPIPISEISNRDLSLPMIDSNFQGIYL